MHIQIDEEKIDGRSSKWGSLRWSCARKKSLGLGLGDRLISDVKSWEPTNPLNNMNDPQPPNPFAAPATTSTLRPEIASMDTRDRKKLDAVIKDANQFWIAILFCFLCSALGLIIIGPWYLVRLLQWNRLGNTYPELRQSAPQPGTIVQKYQSARWKLMAGLIVGATVVFLVVTWTIFVG